MGGVDEIVHIKHFSPGIGIMSIIFSDFVIIILIIIITAGLPHKIC